MDIKTTINGEIMRALMAEQQLEQCLQSEITSRILADQALVEALDIGKSYQEKTKEEQVIELVKGGLENRFGMSFAEFMEIYDNLLENYPEKLV